jgi:RNA polymerase sigma-70 factor (ECF subfamily)
MPDLAKFEQIVLQHLDAAHNLARWLVSDATLAEDVVQDAALRALGYFASYRGGDARAWLLRIVRNTAYDTLTNRRRHAADNLDPAVLDIADGADTPETTLSRREGQALVNRALAALPVELRECLVLRELEELSYKEIAYVTGVPVGTVMSRLWRGRQALMNNPILGQQP